MIHLLPDDFFGQERLAAIRAECGDAESVAYNTTKLEGQRLALDELVAAAAVAPFLAEKRLVVVRKLLAQAERRPEEAEKRRSSRQSENLKAIAAWLPDLPPTTELVLLEEKIPARTSANPVVQAIVRLGGEILESPKLQTEDVSAWIVKRARVKGGLIARDAAFALAESANDDLARLDNEIDKLLVYADGAEIVTTDVRLLVTEAREESIFHLVDAIGSRNQRLALAVLHELLREGSPVPYILTMIARQLRLLLQARELLDRRLDQRSIATQLGLSPWLVRNLVGQANRFAPSDLERAYHRLLDSDQAIKTGRLAPEVAVDLFVAELTAR